MKRLMIAIMAAALLVYGAASALASQFGGALPDILMQGNRRHSVASPRR